MEKQWDEKAKRKAERKRRKQDAAYKMPVSGSKDVKSGNVTRSKGTGKHQWTEEFDIPKDIARKVDQL